MKYPTLLHCLSTDFVELMQQFPEAQIAPISRTVRGVEALFGLKVDAPNIRLNLALVVMPTPKEATPCAYAFLDMRTGYGLVYSSFDSRDAAVLLSNLFQTKGIYAIEAFAGSQPGLPSDN